MMKSITIFCSLFFFVFSINAQSDYDYFNAKEETKESTEVVSDDYYDEAYFKTHIPALDNEVIKKQTTKVSVAYTDKDFANNFSPTNKESNNIVTSYVYHKVKDFTAWEKVYISLEALRKSQGELSSEYGVLASDPTIVYVMNTWPSKEHHDKHISSPEISEAMQKAGVLEAPHINILIKKGE